MKESRGRPRDTSRDVMILDAVLRMLLEVGYDRLSIDGVASLAGVSKATIYRRYPDKAALVTAAVDQQTAPAPRPVSSGPVDVRSVLLEAVTWLSNDISSRGAGLLYAMFAGMRNDPTLAASMRQPLDRDTNEFSDLLRSDTAGRTPLSRQVAGVVGEVAPAMILRRLTVIGLPCDAEFLNHLVDDILMRLIDTA